MNQTVFNSRLRPYLEDIDIPTLPSTPTLVVNERGSYLYYVFGIGLILIAIIVVVLLKFKMAFCQRLRESVAVFIHPIWNTLSDQNPTGMVNLISN